MTTQTMPMSTMTSARAAATAATATTATTAATAAMPGEVARCRSRAAGLLAAALAAALLLSACGTDGSDAAIPPPDAELPMASDHTEDDEGSVAEHDEPDAPDAAPAEPDHAPARVARVTDHLADLDVYDTPGSDAVTHTLGGTTVFDSPTVLLVVDEDGDWLEVLLPVRPNGTTGWIDAAVVEVTEVELHVNVDLEARELTVLDAGEEVLTATVAIGDEDHPTPTGTFSITDKLDTGDPDGPYGPFALGLSGRSDVLTEFAGGDGQIGIHGTNDPSSIGEAASHGCIRVDNEVIEQLAALLPLGTPVTVS